MRHLVLFAWLSLQLFLPCKNRLFDDCQLKKHFWLLKGILKIIPCFGEMHGNISFFSWGFMPYLGGKIKTEINVVEYHFLLSHCTLQSDAWEQKTKILT